MTGSTGELASPGGLISDWSVLGFDEAHLKAGNVLDLLAFLATRGRVSTWSDYEAHNWTSPPAWEWKLMLTGLDGAITRYVDVLGSKSVWDARAAIGEAAWWIAGLTEFLGRSFPDARVFYQELGSTRQGRLVGGLTFLRNRCNHQVPLGINEPEHQEPTALLRTPGASEPSVVRARVSLHKDLAHKLTGDHTAPTEMTFAALRDLPQPDPEFRERQGRDVMYQEEVELRDVGAVLLVARDSFRQTMTIDFSGTSPLTGSPSHE